MWAPVGIRNRLDESSTGYPPTFPATSIKQLTQPPRDDQCEAAQKAAVLPRIIHLLSVIWVGKSRKRADSIPHGAVSIMVCQRRGDFQ